MTRTVGRWKVHQIHTNGSVEKPGRRYGLRIVHRDTGEEFWFELDGADRLCAEREFYSLTEQGIEERTRRARPQVLPS